MESHSSPIKQSPASTIAENSNQFDCPGNTCLVARSAFTTFAFVAVCWIVVLDTIYSYPKNSLLGFAILLMGLPVYAIWSFRKRSRTHR